MMRFSFLLAVFFTVLCHGNAQATSHTVTRHFNVNGVCEQCKARIESASYVRGVKYADWDVKTHDLTVKYDSSKTSPEIILKAVAKSGHDNELYKAESEDYEKIAKCCKYRSGVKMH